MKAFTPVETKNAVTVNIKECFMPAFKLPSVNLPIVNPANNPCAKSKYKNGAANWAALNGSCTPTVSLKDAALVCAKFTLVVKGNILNSIISIIPINMKNIIYPCTTKL